MIVYFPSKSDPTPIPSGKKYEATTDSKRRKFDNQNSSHLLTSFNIRAPSLESLPVTDFHPSATTSVPDNIPQNANSSPSTLQPPPLLKQLPYNASNDLATCNASSQSTAAPSSPKASCFAPASTSSALIVVNPSKQSAPSAFNFHPHGSKFSDV